MIATLESFLHYCGMIFLTIVFGYVLVRILSKAWFMSKKEFERDNSNNPSDEEEWKNGKT